MQTTAPTPRHNWFIFILFLAMCILIWSLTSCGVLKNHYLHKYCQSKDSVSEHTVILYKDTILNVTDTAFKPFYLPNPCKYLCDSLGRLKPVKISHESNGMTKTIENKNGQLVIDCDLKGYKAKLVGAIKETIKDKFKLTTQQVKTNELTKAQGFWIITGQWLLGLLIAYILFKVFKGYLKSYFPFIK